MTESLRSRRWNRSFAVKVVKGRKKGRKKESQRIVNDLPNLLLNALAVSREFLKEWNTWSLAIRPSRAVLVCRKASILPSVDSRSHFLKANKLVIIVIMQGTI